MINLTTLTLDQIKAIEKCQWHCNRSFPSDAADVDVLLELIESLLASPPSRGLASLPPSMPASVDDLTKENKV